MKKLSILLISLIYSTLGAIAAPSQSILTDQMRAAMKHSQELPSITHVVCSVIIMIVLIYLTAFLYQKISVFNAKAFAKADDKSFNLNKMKIVSSMSLGSNKAVHIVEVNGKYLVLGSTPSNITLLKEFDKKDLSQAEMFAAMTNEEVKPEDIEQGLKTIYPEKEQSSESKEQQEESIDYEKVYKKYM